MTVFLAIELFNQLFVPLEWTFIVQPITHENNLLSSVFWALIYEQKLNNLVKEMFT
jgi:hypothetical protein